MVWVRVKREDEWSLKKRHVKRICVKIEDLKWLFRKNCSFYIRSYFDKLHGFI